MRKEILPGTVFGKRTVLGEVSERTSSGQVQYSVQCECGRIDVVPGTRLRQGQSTKCMNCTGRETGRISGAAKSARSRTGGIHNDYMRRLTYLANRKYRNFEVLITMQDLADQWVAQEGKCAISGVPLTLKAHKRDHTGTASVDRIDSKLGYTKDNIQWVHKTVNQMKMDLEESEFFDWCNKISANKDETKRLREGSRPWLKE